MEQDFFLYGKQRHLLRYRRFFYRGKTYSVFIHPSERDEAGNPVLYVLTGRAGRYTLPPEEDRRTLNTIVAALLNNESPFDPAFPGVVWLPWEEE